MTTTATPDIQALELALAAAEQRFLRSWDTVGALRGEARRLFLPKATEYRKQRDELRRQLAVLKAAR